MRIFTTQLVRRNTGVISLLIVLAVVVSGCASKDLPGVEEFKQLTAKAQTSLEASLHSFDKLTAATPPYPQKLVAGFSRDVQRLEVDSIKVRARAQAILARGDAYFADWSESIAQIKKPQIRQLADQFHPQLEQSFTRIKSTSQQAGASFKPYLAGLRELRLKLETTPDELANQAGKDLIRSTTEHGRQVARQLASINAELRAVTTMLTPRSQATAY